MPLLPSPLEPAIYRFGERLARLSAGRTPTLFEGRWWSNQALNLAMQDSRFKAQLFRFIDVLPSIIDDEQVVTLAREYLGDGDTALFGSHWGLKAMSATSLGPNSAAKRSEDRLSIWGAPSLPEPPSRRQRPD
jgi:RHH-type transcriptional regulator, proline utilization regulon repressor / proline dehydrogenase / delta 1-pyrroline-5-carboxylate dehydrogenase